MADVAHLDCDNATMAQPPLELELY